MPLPLRDTLQHTDDRTHSVISFLGREQLVSSFTWSPSASRPQNILTSLQNSSRLIPTGTMTSMLKDKLDGFTSFRGTCVLRLEINSQPFQCGRLLMVAVPMPTLLGGRKDFIFKTITTAQAVNHVQIDISKQTEVILRVPFVSPYNSYDLIENIFDWAEIQILVYSPLNVVEQADPGLNCLLWAKYEDIVLGAPTSAKLGSQVKQQSGKVGNSSSAPTQASPQQVKKTRAQEAITGLSNRIIGAGTQVVSGLAGAALGVANLFGWSKPLPAESGCAVLNRPSEHFATADGLDHSHVLALSASNNIENYPGLVGSNVDEMSFDFIKKIPQYIDNFKFGSNTKPLTQLWKSAVSPMYNVPATYFLSSSSAGLTQQWRQPTTLNYAIAPFAYWTGSLVYTFRFVKTNFHSGRVEFTYHPFASSVDPTRMEYVYRYVVDIRENSEVSLTIPYISPQPWKKIAPSLDPIKNDPVLSSSTGMIYVRALNPLICASSIVSKEIECVVEVRAGDDFQVQSPTASPYIPYAIQQSGVVIDTNSQVMKITDKNSHLLEFQFPAWVKGTTQQIALYANLSGPDYFRVSLPGVLQTTYPIVANDAPLLYQMNYQFSADRQVMDIALKADNPSPDSSVNSTIIVTAFLYMPEGSVPVEVTAPIVCSIDSKTLPLWTTPFGPGDDTVDALVRRRNRAVQQSGSLAAVPGTQETRTRAVEGFLPPSITGKDSDIERQDTSMYCAGEVFRNFRSLTRRFTYCLVNNIPANDMFKGLAVALIRPPTIYYGTWMKQGDPAAKPPIPPMKVGDQYMLGDARNKSEMIPSALSYIAGMYAFYRGGVRMKTFLEPGRNPSNLVSISYSYLDNDEIQNPSLAQNTFEPTAFELPSLKQMGEFQLPYYSPTLISVHWNHQPTDQFDQPQLRYKVGSSSTSNTPLRIAAAASDDLDLELFIGTPPVFRVADLLQDKTSAGLGVWRQFHAPDQFYSPTQTYNKGPTQDPKNYFVASFTPVSVSSIQIRDTVNSAVGTQSQAVSSVREKRDLARQAYRESCPDPNESPPGYSDPYPGFQPPTHSTSVSRRLLSVPDRYRGSAEQFNSDESQLSDEYDSDLS
nr:MAG: structural polyprotein [Dicistroviridae sp.]